MNHILAGWPESLPLPGTWSRVIHPGGWQLPAGQLTCLCFFTGCIIGDGEKAGEMGIQEGERARLSNKYYLLRGLALILGFSMGVRSNLSLGQNVHTHGKEREENLRMI